MSRIRAVLPLAACVAVTAVAHAGAPCDRYRPFPLSPGWAHLGASKTDAPIGGVYHDGTSGAYVSYSAQSSAYVPVKPQDDLEELSAEGVTLRIWKGPDARQRWATEYLEALSALGHGELGPEHEERLPPAGSRSIIAVFAYAKTGLYLVAAAGVSDEEQERRVETLLRSGLVVGDGQTCRFHGVNVLKARRIETLQMGMSIAEVLKTLGPPNDAVRWGADGFATAYGIEGGSQRYSSARLCFDRKQRLAQKVFR